MNKQNRTQLKEKGVTIGLILVVVLVLVTFSLLPNQDIELHALGDLSNAKDVTGYFWMPNAGWIHMQSTNGTWGVGVNNFKSNGPAGADYYEFVGYAWSPNFGWISFNGDSDNDITTSYSVYIRAALNNPIDGAGPWPIDGYAWSPDIGWLDFDAIDASHPDQQPKVTIGLQNPDNPVVSANLTGYAWSPNAGWVDLSEAKIPGWNDTSDPRIIGWDALPEIFPVGDYKAYELGVYKDIFAYDGFAADNFIWVKNDKEFKIELTSWDNFTRFQELYIANVTVGNQYFWKDRLKFRPGQNPPTFTGSLPDPAINSWFNRNESYEIGTNPTWTNLHGEWQAGEDIPEWTGQTHLLSEIGVGAGTAATPYELRVNARDMSGNFACTDGTYVASGDWLLREGCRFDQLEFPLDRVGIAIDDFLPSGQIFKGDQEFTDGDHINGSVLVPLTIHYSDIDSGAARARVSYALGLSEWTVMQDRIENVGREAISDWTFAAGPFGGNDGDSLRLRVEVWDNVGNKRDKIYNLVIDNTPPLGVFEVQDPKDYNNERTRFQSARLYVPPVVDDTAGVRFSNDGEIWSDIVYHGSEEWVKGQPYINPDWDLNAGGVESSTMPGGNKIVYAEFFDATFSPNTTIKTYIIRAPWFEVSGGGDIHANEGIGTTEVYESIAPYSGEQNAAWRITAAGKITPQITTSGGKEWKTGTYSKLAFPGPAGSIAEINWDTLVSMADGVITADDIIKEGAIDFDRHGSLLIAKMSGGGNPIFEIGDGTNDIQVKGKGTLLVNGSVFVKSNMYYEDELVDSVADIDSLGVITRRTLPLGFNASKGNISIEENVNHIVGSYVLGIGNCSHFGKYCEDTGVIHTAVDGKMSPTTSKQELVVNGLVIARNFDLARYSSGTQNYLGKADFTPDQFGQPEVTGGDKKDGVVKCVSNTLPPPWEIAPQPPIPGLSLSTRDNTVDGLGSCVLALSSGVEKTPDVTLFQTMVLPIAGVGSEPEEDFTISVYLKSSLILKDFATLSIEGNSCDISMIDQQWRRFECPATGIESGRKVNFNVNFRYGQIEGKGLEINVAAAQAEFGDRATVWHQKYDDNLSYSASSEHFFYDGRAVMSTPPGFASVTKTPWGESVAD